MKKICILGKRTINCDNIILATYGFVKKNRGSGRLPREKTYFLRKDLQSVH